VEVVEVVEEKKITESSANLFDVSSVNPVFAKLEVEKCPTQYVVVYNEQAEVTRRIDLKDLPTGNSEIIITHVSALVNESSIRVSGGVTTSGCTILEVSSDINTSKPAEKSETEKNSDKEKAAQIRLDISKQQAALDQLQREAEWINSYGSQVKSSRHGTEQSKFCIAPNDASKFMDFYLTQQQNNSAVQRKIRNEISDLENSLKKLLSTNPDAETTKVYRDISILVHMSSPGNVSLQLSYLISRAKWEPAYDLRVQSQVTTVQLIYFGFITNNTGEDWNDVKLSLSTAIPSISGNPPTLNTLRVMSVEPARAYASYASDSSNKFNSRQARSSSVSTTTTSASAASSSNTSVEASATSATFVIKRDTSIASDNKPHKVTVGMIDLQATFMYTTVPKLEKHAFLKAVCTNSSDYPLLAGTMSVFMDNSFVTSSTLKKTNPKDELSMYLGPDAGVVVEYKEEEFNQQKNMLLAKSSVVNYTHHMTIKNTKAIDVAIDVFDNFPQSLEDKVKVTLVQPVLKDDKTAILNEFNNIQWSLKIPPSKSHNITYQYSVEYPKDRDVQYSQ